MVWLTRIDDYYYNSRQTGPVAQQVCGLQWGIDICALEAGLGACSRQISVYIPQLLLKSTCVAHSLSLPHSSNVLQGAVLLLLPSSCTAGTATTELLACLQAYGRTA
jgi:hypothetical protein